MKDEYVVNYVKNLMPKDLQKSEYKLSDFIKYDMCYIKIRLETPIMSVIEIGIQGKKGDYKLRIYGSANHFDLLDYNLRYESNDWNKWDYIFREFFRMDLITVVADIHGNEQLTDEMEVEIDYKAPFKTPPYLRENQWCIIL